MHGPGNIKNTDHKAPHYVISTPLLPCPSKAQNVFLVTQWGEIWKRFLHVGHSYNTISETVRNPINCKQKCASDGGGFNSKNKRATSLATFVSHHCTAAHTVDRHCTQSCLLSAARRLCLSVSCLRTTGRTAVAYALCACVHEAHRSNLDQSVCQLS
jgi:hypothetical protein